MTLFYSFLNTQFGLCLVASTERGVTNVLFFNTQREALKDLQKRWPHANLIKKTRREHELVENYIAGISKIRIQTDVAGTAFQKKVWKELQKIPYGSTITYAAIAKKLGDVKLSRAVGAAIGSNPLGYIVPCHRVIASSGKLSGYRWGIERKKQMLAYESQ